MSLIKNYFQLILLGLVLSSCGGGSSDGTPNSNNDITTPVSPSSLAAQVVSDTQINLSWSDNSDNEASFLLERKSGVSGAYSLIATINANSVTYNDTSLTESTSYTYRVSATNSAGNSTYSNEATATTQATPSSGTSPTTSIDSNFGIDFDSVAGTEGFNRHDGASWLGSGSDSAQDSVVDANGNIFVVGLSEHATTTRDMILLKLTPEGVADVTFGKDYNLDGKLDGYVLFDKDGLHQTDIGYKILLDSSGKILIAGYQGPSGNYSLILWRYDTNGQLDTSFGSDYNNDNILDGYVTHKRHEVDINITGSSEIASDMALDGNGRIVVAGSSNVNGWKDMIVWRFTENGTIDNSFGSDYSGDNIADGFFVHDGAAGLSGKNDVATDILIDTNQKPVITGYSTNANNNWDMVVWRLTTAGILDTTFGGDYDASGTSDGFLIHHDAAGGNSFDSGNGIAEDSNGSYVVAGYSYVNSNVPIMSLWRITSLGALDNTFGEDFDTDTTPDGYTVHDGAAGGESSGAYDLIVDGSNIVVVGYSFNTSGNQDMVVWRYSSAGVLESTFGGDYNNDSTPDGFVVHDNAASGNARDFARSITVVGSDYIVGGMSTNLEGNGDLAVWKFNTTGQLMTSSFGQDYDNVAGVDGYFLLNGIAWGSGNDEATSMFVTANGDAYVAGFSEHQDGDLDIVVWHYTVSGLLDTTFGGDYNNDGIADGYVTRRRSLGDDKALAITVDSSNQIVVTGYMTATLTKPDMAVWRFTIDGKIDNSFGKDNNSNGSLDGYIIHDGAAGNFGGTDIGYAVTTDSNNYITVAGFSTNTTSSTNNDLTIWKFNEVGELDISFGGDKNSDSVPDGFTVFDGTTEGFYQNQGYDMVIDSNNKIIIAGFASKVSSGRQDMALWRYSATGILDASFGNNGYQLHDAAAGVSGNDVAKALALDTLTNKILVTGYSTNSDNNTDLVLWRYDSNGALDSNFGIDNNNDGSIDGFIVMPSNGNASGNAINVKPSANITVAGSTTNTNGTTDLTLWQFSSTGQLETSFGGDYNIDGFADGYFINENIYGITANSAASDIFVDDTNRLIVCGYSTNSFNNTDLSLLRIIP